MVTRGRLAVRTCVHHTPRHADGSASQQCSCDRPPPPPAEPPRTVTLGRAVTPPRAGGPPVGGGPSSYSLGLGAMSRRLSSSCLRRNRPSHRSGLADREASRRPTH